MKTYAIGDIHGCRQHFEKMLAAIKDDAGAEEHRIICLGDYIDRGPDSKGVLDILRERTDIIKLRGNHEAMLLDAYADVRDSLIFRVNGGDQTCDSFGVADERDIPVEYIAWIKQNTRLWYEDDLRVFVHAGIDPSYANMDSQRSHILLWVRKPFLEYIHPFFKYVVHGHTPQNGQPDIRTNRANADSGCVFTGALTCLVFDDTQAEPLNVIQVTLK